MWKGSGNGALLLLPVPWNSRCGAMEAIRCMCVPIIMRSNDDHGRQAESGAYSGPAAKMRISAV